MSFDLRADDRRHPRTCRSPGRSTARRPGRRPIDGPRRREADLRHQRLRPSSRSTSILECARRRRVPDRAATGGSGRSRPRRPARRGSTRSSASNDLIGAPPRRPGDPAERRRSRQHRRARRLLDAAPDGAAPRLVTGRRRTPGRPSDAEVVLAINGVVVGGSKLSTDSDGRDGRVAVLLPQGVLESENEVRAALVVDGEACGRARGGGGADLAGAGTRLGRRPGAADRLAPGGHRDPSRGPERASGWAGGCRRSGVT